MVNKFWLMKITKNINLLIVIVFSLFINGIVKADEIVLDSICSLNYFIVAELDTSTKTLSGYENIRFINITDGPLDTIILHVYPNLFKKEFVKSEPVSSDTVAESVTNGMIEDTGCLSVSGVIVNGDNQPVPFEDSTLLYIPLNQPIAPGDTAMVSLSFDLNIPKIQLRFGYDDNGNYLFAHWYPTLIGFQKGKPVVFQNGGDVEFFSNFANYEVKLKIPAGFKLSSTAYNKQAVGAIKPDSTAGEMAYYNLSAKRVIDFAFACGVVFECETYIHNDTKIDILYLPENSAKLDLIKGQVNKTLDYFNKLLFAYPYPNLSFVDINPGAGGMELPRMVVMSFDNKHDDDNRDLFNTLVHEIGHQWFYATVATNEYSEPWLDEGITTYLTDRAIAVIATDNAIVDILGIKFSYNDFGVFVSRWSGFLDPLATSSDKFYPENYFVIIYGKTAATLKTLEGVVGTTSFDKALKDFAERYKFQHPDGCDLQSSFEQSLNRDLDWFFDSFIFKTARVDYAIESVKSEKRDSVYVSTVELHRNYDGILPQEVVVSFADGASKSQVWDGVDRYFYLEFSYALPAVSAAIDTGGYYFIDENYANNSIKAVAETGTSFAVASELGFIFQLLLAFAGLL